MLKPTENQLCLVSRIGGFGSIDCGLGIGIPTRHGARMFIHFVKAPETRVRAGGRYKDIGPVRSTVY